MTKMSLRLASTTKGVALAAAIMLAGCTAGQNVSDPVSEPKVSPSTAAAIETSGMKANAPIMMRIFKEEGVLEVWKRKDNGRFGLAASYDICKWSGKLGPKFTEGDRQAPEGFYFVRPGQLNPASGYHLSFNIGYPNAYDRANGRTGTYLMVHGGCSSAGCYSMTDSQIEEIYALAKAAFRGGQREFQVQAFPFRMTAENMARYRGDPNFQFWTMLKEGYDHFEATRVPPKVDVCGKGYVFNSFPEGGRTFIPTQACPATSRPADLQAAYATYSEGFKAAFSLAGIGLKKPSPSISGIEEAALVADWSRRRSKGQPVSATPPDLASASKAAVEAAMRPVLAASKRVSERNVRRRAPAVIATSGGTVGTGKTRRF